MNSDIRIFGCTYIQIYIQIRADPHFLYLDPHLKKIGSEFFQIRIFRIYVDAGRIQI